MPGRLLQRTRVAIQAAKTAWIAAWMPGEPILRSSLVGILSVLVQTVRRAKKLRPPILAVVIF
jgi:hypothetical protein